MVSFLDNNVNLTLIYEKVFSVYSMQNFFVSQLIQKILLIKQHITVYSYVY